MAHKPKEYLHIMAWGRYLGSYMWYCRDQQEEAAAEGAPIDALYKQDGERGWFRFADLPPITQRIVERYLP